MAGKDTVEFTESNFQQEALGAGRPALVDFWAEWCPPCRALGPTIDELASDFAGRAVVGKLDVDAHPAIAQRYGVSSIPTLILVSGGEEIGRFVGLRSKDELAKALENALGTPAA